MQFFIILLLAMTTNAKWEEKRDNKGHLLRKYEVDDTNRISGKFETYHPNGKTHLEARYKNSRPLHVKEFFDDGRLARESVHQDKGTQPEIERTEYYQNGKKKLHWIREIKFGEREIRDTENYYDNGQRESSGRTVGSKQVGEHKVFHRDGRPLSIKNFDEKGQPIGVWLSYAYDEAEEVFEDRYENGSLASRTIYGPGKSKKLKEKTYFPDGSIKEEKSF